MISAHHAWAEAEGADSGDKQVSHNRRVVVGGKDAEEQDAAGVGINATIDWHAIWLQLVVSVR